MQFSIPLEKIQANPWQTKIKEPDPDYIRGLAEDIYRNTMLQIPLGRALIYDQAVTLSQETLESKEGLAVQLAFGHSRLAAYRLNNEEHGEGWGRMPVEIQRLTDEQMAILAWSENEFRRELSPLERALAIRSRIDSFHWSQEMAAEKLGISRPVVANALRLLKLPNGLKADLQSGAIRERQALALLPLYEVVTELAGYHDFSFTVDVITGMAR